MVFVDPIMHKVSELKLAPNFVFNLKKCNLKIDISHQHKRVTNTGNIEIGSMILNFKGQNEHTISQTEWNEVELNFSMNILPLF